MAEPWYARAYGEHYFETYGEQFTPEQTAAEVDGLVNLLDLRPGARILDLCCGFGRHSIELARRGFRVTGIDLSPDLLRHAREDAVREGLEIQWIQVDMRDIPQLDEMCDAAVMIFSSYGVLENDDEEAQVARAIGRALKPHARFLIDTVNREVMLQHWMARRWMERPDGTLILNKMRFDVIEGKLLLSEIVIHPDGRRRDDEHKLRFWTYTEMAGLLGRNGFTRPTVFGGLDGRAYTASAPRMVVIAERSDSQIDK